MKSSKAITTKHGPILPRLERDDCVYFALRALDSGFGRRLAPSRCALHCSPWIVAESIVLKECLFSPKKRTLQRNRRTSDPC